MPITQDFLFLFSFSSFTALHIMGMGKGASSAMASLIDGLRDIRRKLKNKDHDEIVNLVR
jgi:hypothetical protein